MGTVYIHTARAVNIRTNKQKAQEKRNNDSKATPPPKKKRSLNTLDDTRLIQIKKTGTHEDALSIHVDVHNPNRNMSICTEDAHSGLRYTADT